MQKKKKKKEYGHNQKFRVADILEKDNSTQLQLITDSDIAGLSPSLNHPHCGQLQKYIFLKSGIDESNVYD